MNDMNQVMLMGRLGADPILRSTKAGLPVTHFNLATSNTASEPDKKQTTWHRIVVWGKQAQSCERFLKKGSTVLIRGRIHNSTYETSDGQTRHSSEINASYVNFIKPVWAAKSEDLETTSESSDESESVIEDIAS